MKKKDTYINKSLVVHAGMLNLQEKKKLLGVLAL